MFHLLVQALELIAAIDGKPELDTSQGQLPLLTSGGVKLFDIWGFVDDERVAKAFGGAIAIMYYGAMQVAFDRGRNIDRIDLAVEPGASLTAVADALHARLGGRLVVATPAQKG